METNSVKDQSNSEPSLYHLKNKNGMVISIASFGATVISIMAPDKSGNFGNVVLGLKDQQAYYRNTAFIGATIGRYANRIARASTKIDGSLYRLTRNEGEHHLHGGTRGLHKVVWDVMHVSSKSLILSCLSKDGDEGYPGNLTVRTSFRLTDDNELVISYHASSDKATPLNLTNHSYFNLSGDPSSSIRNHKLFLSARHYTPVQHDLIPTGEIVPVEDTVFDFTTFHVIGSRMDTLDGGYDHNYVLQSNRDNASPVAILNDPVSGRVLETFTSKPGIQLYTGGNLDGTHISSCGTPLTRYSGICLETQNFPNAPNEPDFPDAILRPGETYRHFTTYRFSVRI